MMYAKLALENVKKSTKDYLIYIVTLTACISMFYRVSIISKMLFFEIPASTILPTSAKWSETS